MANIPPSHQPRSDTAARPARRRALRLAWTLAAALLIASFSPAQANDFADLPPGDEFAPPDELTLPSFDEPQGSIDETEVTLLPDEPAQAKGAGTADEVFDLRTKAIEEQVNDLKEKVFRTKARLMALSEAVLGDRPSGAKLALYHRNELGSSYVLVSAAYTLDGAPLFTRVDESGDLNDREEFVIFDQRIVPGEHQISVQYELRGHGYGVFSYLEGMRLKLRTSYSFTVEPGKVTTVKSILHEKSGITLEFKDKPNVRFETNVQKDVARRQRSEPQASAEGVAP